MNPSRLSLAFYLYTFTTFLNAESNMALHYNRYQSSNGVTVVTPNVDLDLELSSRTELAMRYNVDAVSAASFNNAKSKTHLADQRDPGTCWTCHASTDALSGATHRYTELRQGLVLRIKRTGKFSDAQLNYTRNIENDYESNSVSAGLQHHMNKQNTTLSLGITAGNDRIFPVINNIKEEMTTLGADVGLTQTLSRGTVVNLGYSWASFDGYQANPYSYIQIAKLTLFPEKARHPRQRSRHVVVTSIKQALPLDTAFQADYRYFTDDWNVVSHTVELTLSKLLGESLVLEPGWRYYTQPQGAFFFKNFYDTSETYITRDLKLSKHQTQMLSITLRGKMNENWGMEFRYARYFRTDDLNYALYFSSEPETSDLYQVVFYRE